MVDVKRTRRARLAHLSVGGIAALVLVMGSCGGTSRPDTSAEEQRAEGLIALEPRATTPDRSGGTAQIGGGPGFSEGLTPHGEGPDIEGPTVEPVDERALIERWIDDLRAGEIDIVELTATARARLSSSLDRFQRVGPAGLGAELALDPRIADCVGDGSGSTGVLGLPRIGADERPPEVQLAETVDWLESERGLAFSQPLRVELVTEAEMASRIRALVSQGRDGSRSGRDQRLLTTLGALPSGARLDGIREDLLSAQVSGYFDPDTGDLVVRSGDPDRSLDALELATLAHEIDHALVADGLGVPRGDDLGELGTDNRRAALSVVEGEATLAMQRFALGRGDGIRLFASGATSGASGPAVPHFVAGSVLFPYEQGLVFVCDRYRAGGWAAVDTLYGDLPSTSAQILFPDRYLTGEGAAIPRDLGAPGPPWTLVGTDTFGAAELLWLFEAPGDDAAMALDDPLGRAAAWGGGTYRVWASEGGSALGISLVDRGDDMALCDSMRAWYAAAFPDSTALQYDAGASSHESPNQQAFVACWANHVTVAIAPDLASATAIATSRPS